MKCSILLDSKPYFFSYVRWIIEKSVSWDFDLCGIYAKDSSLIKKSIDYSNDFTFFKNIDSVLKSSDIVISLGYWKILTAKQISQVPYGIINFHHSYKLKYKGRHAASWVIRNEEKVHGSTMHYINEELDSGSIIDSKYFKIKKHATAEEIFVQANHVGLNLLKNNFKNIINKKPLRLIEPSKEYYTYKEKDLSHEISLKDLKNPDKVYREVRALTFENTPAPYFKVNNKKVFLNLDI